MQLLVTPCVIVRSELMYYYARYSLRSITETYFVLLSGVFSGGPSCHGPPPSTREKNYGSILIVFLATILANSRPQVPLNLTVTPSTAV